MTTSEVQFGLSELVDLLHLTGSIPGWVPRPKPDMSRPKWTHEGGVVRSKLHGLETRMNARWSGHERTMVWTWTHDGLVNARCSGHERTKVGTWTHEKFSCVHFQTFLRSCPDHRAVMSRPSCVHVQTIVRSCPDFRAFTRRKKNYLLGCSAIPWRWRQRGFQNSTNPYV